MTIFKLHHNKDIVKNLSDFIKCRCLRKVVAVALHVAVLTMPFSRLKRITDLTFA